MKKDKTKLLKFLEKRQYADLPTDVFSEKKGKKSLFKAESKKAADKKKVESIKRFQKFSDLKVTGRVNKTTLEKTETTFCGFPDVSSRELMAFSSSLSSWNTTSIPYAIGIITDQIPASRVESEIRRAFNKWTEAFPRFNFRRVQMFQRPLIVLSFATGPHADEKPFTGRGGDLAHAFPPNHHSTPGQVHFDDDEEWSTSASGSQKDFFTVAVHEIGHALGLGHSNSRLSWMFHDYEGPRSRFAQEDINNITNLYRNVSG